MPHTLRALVMLAWSLGLCVNTVGCTATPEEREARRLEREIKQLDNEIRRVDAELRRDPQPLGDWWPNFCTVHGRRLQEAIVPIVYGLVTEAAAPDLRQTRVTEFPNAYTYEWGGCCVEPGQPKRAHVKFCPDCRAARRRFYDRRRADGGVGNG